MATIFQGIITSGAVIGAMLTIFGVIKASVKLIQKSHKNREAIKEKIMLYDTDIARLKEENTLICFGLCAALDGLEQLGANHTVPIAKGKLDKYLNTQAHK